MGDSLIDAGMLHAADIAYVPGNGSRQLRALPGKAGFHFMREPRQRGLLAAVRHLTQDHRGLERARLDMEDGQVRYLPDIMLDVADRRWLARLFHSPNR